MTQQLKIESRLNKKKFCQNFETFLSQQQTIVSVKNSNMIEKVKIVGAKNRNRNQQLKMAPK